MAINNSHKVFGLIGFPLGHSFSAEFFAEKFRREDIAAEYRLWEIPSLDSVAALPKDVSGFNVTIPHKVRIMDFLDEIDPEAKAIGAVNVVKVISQNDGSIVRKGYNTDALGFLKSLKAMKGFSEADIRQALVLGSGGASKAVVHALKKLGIQSTVVSRNPGPEQIGYNQINSEIMATHRLIVNCTPLGTYPDINSYPDIPYEKLSPNHYCHDLVYNPSVTRFMQLSQTQGATVKNGLEMLRQQALAAWEIWTDDNVS